MSGSGGQAVSDKSKEKNIKKYITFFIFRLFILKEGGEPLNYLPPESINCDQYKIYSYIHHQTMQEAPHPYYDHYASVGDCYRA